MTNLTIFDQDKANELFNSTKAFPINFDDAWRWLEYSKKDKAKDYLIANLEEGIDFLLERERRENISSSHFGGKQVTTVEEISLSIEGFKNWAMMSKTATGKQVRKYFIKCELIAKQKAQRVIPEKLDVATRIESLANNDRLPASVKQLLIDSLVNEYIDNTPKLEASTERWVGLAQKAEELGFKINSSNRVKLGHYGTKELIRLKRQREERLCNGEMRAIWVYLDNKDLEQVIREYFAIERIKTK